MICDIAYITLGIRKHSFLPRLQHRNVGAKEEPIGMWYSRYAMMKYLRGGSDEALCVIECFSFIFYVLLREYLFAKVISHRII